MQLKYDQEYIASLHKLACIWLADNGYVEEALQHALAAGDNETAVRIIAQNRCKLMNDENGHPLDRWLQLFSREVIDQEPELLLTKVWDQSEPQAQCRYPGHPRPGRGSPGAKTGKYGIQAKTNG